MSPQAALRNLLRDAQFFQLDKLEAAIKSHQGLDSALESLGYTRIITPEELSEGVVGLERDCSKWAPGEVVIGTKVPLAGDLLPPLIRFTNVNLL